MDGLKNQMVKLNDAMELLTPIMVIALVLEMPGTTQVLLQTWGLASRWHAKAYPPPDCSLA